MVAQIASAAVALAILAVGGLTFVAAVLVAFECASARVQKFEADDSDV